MLTSRLAPYILVSFLIHAGVLIGAHQFLKLPSKELETAELIAVEMVVVREESPASRPELVLGDRIWPKKSLQTKSQKMMETATDRSADDMTTPIPKAGGFEPNATIAGMATTGFIAEALAGESADSKPIVPASQLLPSQITPLAPPIPIETALMEVKMTAVPIEINTKLTPADFQTLQRVATPQPASRPAAEPGFEPPNIATKSSEEPRLNVAMVPTRGFTPVARNGESVAGKPMILASHIFPSQVSPINPSMPAESFQLEVKIPEILVEVKAKLTPADSQTPQKVARPLPGSRPAAEPVFEPLSLATTSYDEPRLTLNTNPTLKNVPRAPQAESVAGKPMILASQMSTWQFAPADPSAPSTPSPSDVRMPVVPIEAKLATISADFQTPQKIETPLASRRPREDLAAEHQPTPREGAYEPVLRVSTLQVQSQPNGAQVYVNGRLFGETPLAWELPLGKHEIRLALPDYYDWEAQVNLTERNQVFPIFLRLLPVE